jgi:prophage DNA circulation protein
VTYARSRRESSTSVSLRLGASVFLQVASDASEVTESVTSVASVAQSSEWLPRPSDHVQSSWSDLSSPVHSGYSGILWISNHIVILFNKDTLLQLQQII